MKRKADNLIPSLLLILASCVPIWRNINSEDGGFDVEFPGAPEERVETEQAPFGELEWRHLAFLPGRWGTSWHALYLVSSGKMVRTNDGRPGADEFIDWQYDETLIALATNHAGGDPHELEIVDDIPVDLDGHAGRAFKVLESKGAPTHVRLYYVDGTFYRLIVEDEDEAKVERFLESFRLHQRPE